MKELLKIILIISFTLFFSSAFSYELKDFDLRGKKSTQNKNKLKNNKVKVDSRFYQLIDSKLANVDEVKSENYIRGSMASMGQTRGGITNNLINNVSNNVVIVDNWIKKDDGGDPIFNGTGAGLIIHNFATDNNDFR